MKRLTLFVKGNVDVHDSLHSCRVAGKLLWNGVNDVLRETHPGVTARIRHETWARSDALLQATGVVPDAVAARDLPLGSYPAASQFSGAIFETQADAIILSLQPDIASGMVRHKADGFIFYPSEHSSWAPEDRAWLKADFESAGHLSVEASMANLTRLIERLRETTEAPILIYNLSPIIPGETIHCHLGMGETYSTRIRRFNLALAELSEATGISIIDVDTVLARHGADALKLDAIHLTAAGYELVAREVVRVLEDLGVLTKEEA